MRVLGIFLVALLWFGTTVAEDDPVDCRDGGMTQTNMNICSERAAAVASAFLKDLEVFLGKDEDSERQALIAKARSAWATYATAQCEMEADFYRGGSIQPLIQNTCLRALTLWRARRLIIEGLSCVEYSDECPDKQRWLRKLEQVEKLNRPPNPDALTRVGERQRRASEKA